MTKTIILFYLTFAFYSTVLAQNFKNIRLNFGFQGNFPERVFNRDIPKYNNKNGGGGIHIYPKWFYNNHNSLGLNIEYVLVTENYQSDAIGSFDIVSFCPTLNHYFFKSNIRPFIGIGAGSYSVLYHSPKFNFGIKPLIGINIHNYLEISLEYNRILNKITINPYAMGHFDNYYFGIKGSVSIGVLKLKK